MTADAVIWRASRLARETTPMCNDCPVAGRLHLWDPGVSCHKHCDRGERLRLAERHLIACWGDSPPAEGLP